MKKDISIMLPSIRPQFLDIFYDTATKACKKHSFEIIVPGPFDVSAEARRNPNVKILKTYAAPTVAIQMAMQMCSGELVYYAVDDQVLLENVLDETIEVHRDKLKQKDVICMKYHEDPTLLNYKTMELLKEEITAPTQDIWFAGMYGDLRLPGIDPNWRLAPLFCMKVEYFHELGGFDCRWEYTNCPVHDLIFRIQSDGGKVINSPSLISIGAWQPNHTGDHAPVHDAQLGPDTILFNQIYSEPDAASRRIKLCYSNWKEQPDVWARRFNTTPLWATREEYEATLPDYQTK